MEYLSDQAPSLNQLELGNKLLNVRENHDDVYFHFHEFVTNNNEVCIEKIIEKDLHLFAKCFCDILKPTMNHLRHCFGTKVYDVLSKQYALTVYDCVELNELERFLDIVTEQQPDIITYSEIAKIAVLNRRPEMLEIVFQSIKLPFETIDYLYELSKDSEDFKSIILAAEPEYVLKKLENEDIEMISDSKTEQVSKKLEMIPDSEDPEFNIPAICEDTLIRIYFSSIRDKNNELFKQLYTHPCLIPYHERAMTLAEEDNNMYLVDTLRSAIFDRTAEHYDGLIKSAYTSGNLSFIDHSKTKCTIKTFHDLLFKSIHQTKLDILKILLQNKVSEIWFPELRQHAQKYNQDALQYLF